MSAMHWEARQRQTSLDRRMARDQQKLLQKNSESSQDATESNIEAEHTAGGQCPYCKDDVNTSANRRAKIPNRYSSLQYTQQW